MTLLVAGKFLLYLGVMLLLGGVAARHLFRLGRPGVGLLLLGLGLLGVGAALGVYGVLTELDMLNPGDTLDYLTRVAAGRAALTLLLGGCLLLAAHLSQFSRLTEVGAAGLLLWGLAGVGHGAVHGEFVRFLHLLHAGAMSVWLAGVLTLLSPGLPEREPLFRRFSPVALACVATLVLTGVPMALNHAGSLLTLPESGYGRLLLLKLAVFAGALLAALALRTMRAGRQNWRAALLLESLLLLLVLVLTAQLTQLPPPSHQI